jgi:cytochrome c-type biogenesis protein CcmF
LLGIFGTFITRSGVVNSVHAFADSHLGMFFVYYMAFVLAVSLFLIIDRLSFLKTERPLDSVLSRESAFLFNNLILLVACFAVLWGTMFPVLSEAVQGSKITVGPPFFNNVNIPIGLFLLFLTGVGPFFAWRKTSMESLKKAFYWPTIFSALVCVALVLAGMRSIYSIISFTLCMFVTVTIFEEFYKATRIRAKNTGENLLRAITNLTLKNKRRYGGYVVHFAVVLMFIGLTGNAFNREASQLMVPGDEMKLGHYTLKMDHYREGSTPNYQYGIVTIKAYKDGKLIRTMNPEKRSYLAGEGQTTTEVALHSTPVEDLYLVFAGMSNDGGKYEIKAYLNPLVWWLWFGAAVMVFGTAITLLPDRKGAFTLPTTTASGAVKLEETVAARTK